jgi:hypothetical protein
MSSSTIFLHFWPSVSDLSGGLLAHCVIYKIYLHAAMPVPKKTSSCGREIEACLIDGIAKFNV